MSRRALLIGPIAALIATVAAVLALSLSEDPEVPSSQDERVPELSSPGTQPRRVVAVALPERQRALDSPGAAAGAEAEVPEAPSEAQVGLEEDAAPRPSPGPSSPRSRLPSGRLTNTPTE